MEYLKKNLLGIILIIFGIISYIYIAYIRVIATTKVAFSLPVILMGTACIIYGIFRLKILELEKEYKSIKIIKRSAEGILILLLVIISISAAFMFAHPKFETSESDYVIVLGAGLTNGMYPNASLRSRLEAAAEYTETYSPSAKIIVSGGQGDNELISEAEAMKNYLVDLGISEDKIILEDKSTITKENLVYSKKIIEEDSGKSTDDLKIKIATSDFHAFRSSLLAEKAGYKNVTNYSGKTILRDKPISYLRESFAIVKSYFFD